MPINSQAVACENVIDLVISTAVTNLNITVKNIMTVNIQNKCHSLNIRAVFGKFFPVPL